MKVSAKIEAPAARIAASGNLLQKFQRRGIGSWPTIFARYFHCPLSSRLSSFFFPFFPLLPLLSLSSFISSTWQQPEIFIQQKSVSTKEQKRIFFFFFSSFTFPPAGTAINHARTPSRKCIVRPARTYQLHH